MLGRDGAREWRKFGIGIAGERAWVRVGGVLLATGDDVEATDEVAKGFLGDEEGSARLKDTVRGVAENGPGSGGKRIGEEFIGVP